MAVLTDPFPTQQQLIDHQYLHVPSSLIDEFKMMSSELVHITTRSQCYDPPPERKGDNALVDKTKTSIPLPTNGLQI